jgi:hypothetical protein
MIKISPNPPLRVRDYKRKACRHWRISKLSYSDTVCESAYTSWRRGDVGRSVCMTRQCQHTRGPVLIGVFPIIAGRKVGGRRGHDLYYDGSRLNMEIDLQSLFGLHVTWCAQLYSLAETPQPPPPLPPHWDWDSYTRAQLVSKYRRHLLVIPWW